MSSAHALGGVSGVASFNYYWWTASIIPRLLFSLADYASWGLSHSSVLICIWGVNCRQPLAVSIVVRTSPANVWIKKKNKRMEDISLLHACVLEATNKNVKQRCTSDTGPDHSLVVLKLCHSQSVAFKWNIHKVICH